MQTLKGRTCVFAGASGGDGVSAVRALCAGGMNVVMVTHQIVQAQLAESEINAAGYPGRCAVLQEDKTAPPAEMYEKIHAEYGSVDVIICNTGTDGLEESIDTVSPQDLLRAVTHLLGGSYEMLWGSLAFLRKSSAPRVIFMTTVEGVRGGSRESFTNAVAKGAVYALAKNCAARLAPEGITVNCIEKGAMKRLPADMHAAPDKKRLFKDSTELVPYVPMGRAGTPEDLAEAICFLASEESAYVTGTVLDLSGGLSLV